MLWLSRPASQLTKGSPALAPSRLGMCLQTPHPRGRGWWGSRSWSTWDKDIKEDSDPIRKKILLSSEFPKLAGCYEHLASFLGDRCGIDLDLKLIDMHISRQTPVSPTCSEPGKPGHHLLPFHSAHEGFQGVYSGCKMLFFLSWS